MAENQQVDTTLKRIETAEQVVKRAAALIRRNEQVLKKARRFLELAQELKASPIR